MTKVKFELKDCGPQNPINVTAVSLSAGGKYWILDCVTTSSYKKLMYIPANELRWLTIEGPEKVGEQLSDSITE